MEYPVHITGMLDRDQRTAKLRFFCDRHTEETCSFLEKTVSEPNANPNSIISHRSICRCHTRTRRSKSSYLRWKKAYFIKSFHKLVKLLVVAAYLSLVTFPSTSSTPVNLKMSERMKELEERMNWPRKWINPCGSTPEVVHNTGSSSEALGEKEINPIVNQAKSNLDKATTFKDIFADKTYGMPFDSIQKKFQIPTSFLDINLPKELGKDIPQDILETLTIDQTLLDSYEFLQKLAVGLEQVSWDEQDNMGPLAKEYADMEDQLRSLLCELQMVILAQGITMRKDIDRDIIDNKYRLMVDATYRHSRDWLILREYLNTLEYVQQAFTHLKSKTK